jgi:hypothetical protein
LTNLFGRAIFCANINKTAANKQTISHSNCILRAILISMAPEATAATAAALKARKAAFSLVMAGYFSFIMRGKTAATLAIAREFLNEGP